MKNLLSIYIVVNRRDLGRLNYNKTVFGRGYALDPAKGAHNAHPYHVVVWGGDPIPIYTSS